MIIINIINLFDLSLFDLIIYFVYINIRLTFDLIKRRIKVRNGVHQISFIRENERMYIQSYPSPFSFKYFLYLFIPFILVMNKYSLYLNPNKNKLGLFIINNTLFKY